MAHPAAGVPVAMFKTCVVSAAIVPPASEHYSTFANTFCTQCNALMERISARPCPVKVAFIYVDPVGDTGWSYQHDVARRELEHVLGAKVKTTYVESVPATADA